MNTESKPAIYEILLRQLTQKSTVIALASAIALIAGWQLAPEKLDAIAMVVSLITTTALAVVQERQGPVTTTTTVSTPPSPPVTVTTTTDDSAPAAS
jgi:hypothetical protein